ncbi:type IV pilus modification protein PilV [uncultured Thiohalocapsa sp.]|uniref:type IV pilus modification protein PilV n=1 Tax=uncultured Thiohalocapsa sp. TaxID=768990 RepID=UPI0025FCB0A2|nr:type IV pilus modification protein PilV [uncultured Thiohalocapsa sp.]
MPSLRALALRQCTAEGRSSPRAAGCGAAQSQRGTSLMEVLVTLAILTLGITAMTQLQVTALKLNHSAYMRSQAVALSYRVLDAMRANRGDALFGAYDRAPGDPIPTAAEAGSSVAAADLRAWLHSVENAMRPYEGQAGIDRNAAEVTITVRWRDRLREERLGARGRLWEEFSVVTQL